MPSVDTTFEPIATRALTLDELCWLRATARLEEMSLPSSPIRVRKGSLWHRPQRQSLVGHAAVTQNSSSSAPKMRYIVTPPTPVPTPPPHSNSPPHSPDRPYPKLRSPLSTGCVVSDAHLSPPSSESSSWLYRTPKPRRPDSLHIVRRSPSRPSAHIPSSLPTKFPINDDTFRPRKRRRSNTTPFWSTLFHTRAEKEFVTPDVLKSQASQCVHMETAHPVSPGTRTPSLTSTASTVSTSSISTSFSSRTDTPVVRSLPTPGLARPEKHEPNHRAPYPVVPCLSHGSKLTRTPTSSSKASSCATGTSIGVKSVKFVEEPTVHYASGIPWSVTAALEPPDLMMGMDLDGMDMGDNLSSSICSVRSSTPTPAPERRKSTRKRLKHIVNAGLGRSQACETPRTRPVISGPVRLGARSPASSFDYYSGASKPTRSATPVSTPTSLDSPRLRHRRSASAAVRAHTRCASSTDSVESVGKRSVRSCSSLKSNGSGRSAGIRAWLRIFGVS